MYLTNWLMKIFSGNRTTIAPLLIIKQDTKEVNIKEYQTIEEAIADLENDTNVPSEKIEKLKASLKKLKNKTSITIRNGEILL
jgi:septal ring factor EnvC (AmiA/AmiB activator)